MRRITAGVCWMSSTLSRRRLSTPDLPFAGRVRLPARRSLLSAPCSLLPARCSLLAFSTSYFLLSVTFSALGNAVLFFEARFETLQIYRNPWLRAFRGRPEILDRPCDWLLQFPGRS